MATTISDWNDEVANYVKFSSSYATLVTAEVVEVLRDFCRDTGIWKETLADISVVADQATYTLTIPTTNGDDPELVYIDVVKWKEDGADDDQYTTLDPMTETEVDLHDHGSWEYHTSSAPTKYRSSHSKDLILYPIPTEASTDGLRVKVVCKPDIDSTTCPDWIWDDYKRAIAIGTASNLMHMPNKPWSNAEMAAYYQNIYEARRDEAYQNVKLMYTKAAQQAHIPWAGGARASHFFGGRRSEDHF